MSDHQSNQTSQLSQASQSKLNNSQSSITSTSPLTGVKGMNDILPQDAPIWLALEHKIQNLVKQYHYDTIRTPIVEHTAVFKRGIGEVTDIVEKEMYRFIDALNGDDLTLRPENTAAVVRSVTEHHLLHDGAKRLSYIGPMFRHERPQKGRLRQFHQFGIEAFGFDGVGIEAEQLAMIYRLWHDLGFINQGICSDLTPITLEINTLGKSAERSVYRQALIDYFSQEHIYTLLSENEQHRLTQNPLRLLDSKNKELQPFIEKAPHLWDYLTLESQERFLSLQQILTQLKIPFKHNHRMVRGLDYYNDTVFEWTTTALGSQGTICAGGRYDGLVTQLSPKQSSSAFGFGMGLERVILLWEVLKGTNLAQELTQPLDFYIVHEAETLNYALAIAEVIRHRGFSVSLALESTSFKNQLKKANNCHSQYVIFAGGDEQEKQQVLIKAFNINNVNAFNTVTDQYHQYNQSKFASKLALPTENGQQQVYHFSDL